MRVVAAADWLAEWTQIHANGLAYFDFLTAVDRGDTANPLEWRERHTVLLSTTVGALDASLDSLSCLYLGAAWHERETREMFGVRFPGLADTRPLLLRTSLGAPPLRKSTVLAARVAVDWPGAAEPGGSPGRRRQRPPGVAADWLADAP